MNIKTQAILVLGALLLGAGLGYYLVPTKTVIKTETVTVTKEVEKKTDDTQTKKQNDKDYVTTVTTYPDGRVVKETRLIDKSTTVTDNKSTDDTKKDSKTDTKTEKTVTKASPVVIYGLGSVNLSNFAAGPDYGLGLQKQVLGPIWAGAQFMKSSTFGVTLGIAF